MVYYPSGTIFSCLTSFQRTEKERMEYLDNMVEKAQKLPREKQIEYLEKISAIPNPKQTPLIVAEKILEEMLRRTQIRVLFLYLKKK